MRWQTRYYIRQARRIAWHRWFAWYPVYFDGYWHWLEFVICRFYGAEWEYIYTDLD